MNYLSRLSFALLLCCAGCLYRVQVLGNGHKKPSNVAIYVQIDNRFRQPIINLDSSKFQIEEDGKPVTTQESRQVILNPQAGAVHYTMLLLDLSGSMAKSNQLKPLERAVSAFSDQISEIQRVGVYAFDGSPNIKAIVPFTANPAELKAGISGILSFRPTDLSTNLYGAVVEGLNTLKAYRDKPGNPKLSFATLVVFTDGSDLANRITKAQLKDQLDASAQTADQYIRIFAVGLGDSVDRSTLRLIGRDGNFTAGEEQELKTKFGKVADRIEKSSHRYYLLSYCSPARAGEHTLKVKVVDGKLRRGRASYSFDADGFTANCNPNDLPELQRPDDVKNAEQKAKADAKAKKDQDRLDAKEEKKNKKEDKKKQKEEEKLKKEKDKAKAAKE